MIEAIKQKLSESADLVVTWLTNNGMNLAGRILAALVILLVGALVIKLFERFLRKLVENRDGDRALLERFVVSVGSKAAWIVLLTIVLAKLGVDVGPLIAGLGATGFILGFAFQESLGSLAAGIMIAFNRPFKIGDFVSVAGFEGVIHQLDMMAVVLTTGDNRKITIPNKQAWGSAIVNYSAMPIRRIEVTVGIAYSADITKACAVALEAIGAIPAVLKDPAPASLIAALGESAVTLGFRAWVNNADYWPVLTEATRRVKEAFDRNGIAIPFPQVDVHMIGKA